MQTATMRTPRRAEPALPSCASRKALIVIGLPVMVLRPHAIVRSRCARGYSLDRGV
jgi:hypothetical protein